MAVGGGGSPSVRSLWVLARGGFCRTYFEQMTVDAADERPLDICCTVEAFTPN
jgi:hypothetical protein